VDEEVDWGMDDSVAKDGTTVSDSGAGMEGVPIADGPRYETVLSSVSDKVDGVSSVGADSGGNTTGSRMLEVTVETTDVRDDGRGGTSGRRTDETEDWIGDRGVDETGDRGEGEGGGESFEECREIRHLVYQT
jgi:hypothetical protein